MNTIPTVEETKFLPLTDFCKRYNEGRPESMKLEPSFVKLLCDQKSIEHSELPSHDGRKNDVYMIPEYELDKVDILLNGNETEKTIDTKQAALLLKMDRCYINQLVREGKLKAERVGRKNVFKESDVLDYLENTTSRKRKPNDGFTDLKKMDCDGETKAYIMQLEAKNNELIASNAAYADLINSLRKDLTTLEEEKANWLISSEGNIVSSSDKDIFEAYRRGFKDGFEMGGRSDA